VSRAGVQPPRPIRYHPPVISLTPAARRALETARAEGQDLRFVLLEHCHTGRWRLSVRYRVADRETGEPRDVNLGLAWSEDQPALERLRGELERQAGG
jgi:hypothetical protein